MIIPTPAEPDLRSGLPALRDGATGNFPISVLVVDDSPSVRSQLGRFIKQLENVELVEAGSHEEVVRIVDSLQSPFFCAIVDLTLPDSIHGEVVDLLQGRGVPVIVLTGSFSTALRKSMWDRGIIDYMEKSSISALEDVAYLVGCLRKNSRTKVLVVDDSETFRCYMQELLNRYRFPVLAAANGREGLALLEENPDIGLILTDYFMPELNGIEMVRQMHRRHRRESLPILALSDAQRPALSAAMLKAGANDFLNKNFQLEEFYCRVQLNTNMAHAFRQLRDLADKDYLTRLYNRRYFFQSAEALHHQARAGKRGLTLAMMDVDHFKHINDAHGHPVGDLALKRIAEILQRVLAGAEVLARFGGEEFVCIVTPGWRVTAAGTVRSGPVGDRERGFRRRREARGALHQHRFHRTAGRVAGRDDRAGRPGGLPRQGPRPQPRGVQRTGMKND